MGAALSRPKPIGGTALQAVNESTSGLATMDSMLYGWRHKSFRKIQKTVTRRTYRELDHQQGEHMSLTGSLSQTVSDVDTAAMFGPDFPKAASTPFVLGLAEVACHNIVAGELQDGELTVGTAATIEHLLPSAVGATLTARATLVERDGRRLHFTVEVFDGDNVCATLTHSRAVAQAQKIADRLAQHGG